MVLRAQTAEVVQAVGVGGILVEVLLPVQAIRLPLLMELVTVILVAVVLLHIQKVLAVAAVALARLAAQGLATIRLGLAEMEVLELLRQLTAFTIAAAVVEVVALRQEQAVAAVMAAAQMALQGLHPQQLR